MPSSSKHLLALSLGVIIIAIIFVVLMVLLVTGGEWIFSEVATETIYLCLAIYTFYHIYKMEKGTIAFGWSLFCLGLAIDLSDEVSGAALVLHKNFEDWASMIGIFVFAVGFHRENIVLTHSLGKEQQRAETLADKAFTDELTGIANRPYLLKELQTLIDCEKIICLYFIDLNKFKPANDTHGHEVGDLLLKAVATRLAKLSRSQDILARWGGDEFILVLSFDDDEMLEPMEFAQRISRSFDQPFGIGNLKVELGASIGYALYPDHAKGIEKLIHKADLAMYESKRKGEGPCEFDPGLHSD